MNMQLMLAEQAVAKREKTKGVLGGFCGLAICRTKPALWYHAIYKKHYCRNCARIMFKLVSKDRKKQTIQETLTEKDFLKLTAMEQAILTTFK